MAVRPGWVKQIRSVCGRRDLNPHALRHRYLKPACIPISPLPRVRPQCTGQPASETDHRRFRKSKKIRGAVFGRPTGTVGHHPGWVGRGIQRRTPRAESIRAESMRSESIVLGRLARDEGDRRCRQQRDGGEGEGITDQADQRADRRTHDRGGEKLPRVLGAECATGPK